MIFSMIVPLFHGEKYIATLISMAIENQKTLGVAHELELIFINDSPEAPVEQASLPFAPICVQLLENSCNKGIHSTRIAGIEAARGEYLLLLDQDDKIESHFFVSQLRCLQTRKKADVIVANGVTEYPRHEKLLYRWNIMQWTTKHMLFYALFDCRILSPGHCLIRKACIPSAWLQSPLESNGADDMLLWLMLLSKKACFSLNREALYRHCYTASNASLDRNTMISSAQELIEIGRKTQSIKRYILQILSNRIAFQTGQEASLFWKALGFVRTCGERINRT